MKAQLRHTAVFRRATWMRWDRRDKNQNKKRENKKGSREQKGKHLSDIPLTRSPHWLAQRREAEQRLGERWVSGRNSVSHRGQGGHSSLHHQWQSNRKTQDIFYRESGACQSSLMIATFTVKIECDTRAYGTGQAECRGLDGTGWPWLHRMTKISAQLNDGGIVQVSNHKSAEPTVSHHHYSTK